MYINLKKNTFSHSNWGFLVYKRQLIFTAALKELPVTMAKSVFF